MVAEWIRVTSRSYRQDAQAATWYCTGEDTFTVEPAEKETRGTQVVIKLKEDAKEFTQPHALREIIRKHSDFVPFPIYLGDDTEQVNRQTAIWRQQPREVEQKDYDEFYQQLTLDFEPPLAHAHMVVDAPVQMYALLYIPAKAERSPFALRKEDGLKLYARKVLIQEYNRDLLPEYLWFVQGVVDLEDLPLNVSREMVQSTRVMTNLKKLLKSKVLDTLKKMGEDDPEKYSLFWKEYARAIKQGVAIETDDPEALHPLLRFHTTLQPEQWSSLEQYVQSMQPDQKQIYYILGDDERSVLHSPHLDAMRRFGFSVLILADPLDAFMLTRLTKYKDLPLTNVAAADLELPKQEEKPEEERAGAGRSRIGHADRAFQGPAWRAGQRCAHHRPALRLACPAGRPARRAEPGDPARLSLLEPRSAGA